MATAAQVEVNRRNAQLSTGPRTAQGRARSAQNAVKHGFTGRLLVGLRYGHAPLLREVGGRRREPPSSLSRFSGRSAEL